ncbi:hypothetical protein K443DRAFT_684735 [Laccaria amethystina LaAM-08-1]|uniref:SH3 domain-containing protein n=1 Tax=Laccaria amethystina LaAM-08-1 TaxID=1095629 RepID=A0A0C9WWH4_9AGAR|nr:hypothetical protein K443DRAFT_684735 [Laccaria amethystina LaAM-08-1]
MQLRDSSSGTAIDGADQHTQCGRAEETAIAPEANSSRESAPVPEELFTPGFRAEALYDYRALAFGDDDREEVSFSKLDTFDVLDNSGKWWTVRKDNNGRIGIAPSKFLQVIT